MRFGAKRGLEAHTYRGWLASVEAGRPTSIPGPLLAWASTATGGVCILSRGFLSVWTPSAQAEAPTTDTDAAAGWRHVGWHQIERGNFAADDRRLSWTTYAAATDHVVLPEPGRVPEVFRERVAASIAVEEFVPLDADDHQAGVTVSGRRDLSRPHDAAISWHATLPNGVSPQTPGIEELAEAGVARLRIEYDPQV
jgi:hypothetical protein